MIIPIKRNYYDEYKIHNKTKIELQPGLTVLVGCNGAGKSTLLHQIKDYCNKTETPCYSFDNFKQGGDRMNDKLGYYGDFQSLANNLCSSEGEQINNNLCHIASDLGIFIRTNVYAKNAKTVFILFDAVDSGFSVDNVIELKQDLFHTVLEDLQKDNVEAYIIVSANEYELARKEKCFNVITCQYVNLRTYESFRRLVIKTKQQKLKRYGQGEWDYDTE